MRRRRWHEIPAVRNALGLHSPSRAMLGRCTCRRCRRGLPPRFDETPVRVAMMRASAAESGFTLFDPIPHEPGSCEECDRRREKARHEETP